MHATFRRGILLTGLALTTVAARAQEPDPLLLDLSLEELGEVRITSVSRRPERVADAAASVFVITADDIRRSGAASLPEALRLAPNLQVARIDRTQYAISARGFNAVFANKLLVLVDGRTVYTPLFSGVFWDQQDVLLADVERIEVISGPGATLWGANAVNGVINVITRNATDTEQVLASVGAGSHMQNAAFRYGGPLTENGAYRVYAKGAKLDHSDLESGAAGVDGWESAQVGFRADFEGGDRRFTVQADVHIGESQDRGSVLGIDFGRVETEGANVLARWAQEFESGSQLQVRTYVDHTERDDALFFSPSRDTFDIEAQYRIPLGRHDVLLGGGYRQSRDEVGAGLITSFIPASRDLAWRSMFAQNRVALNDRLDLTVGLKLEHNEYTGTESLPTVRLAWKPTDERLLWTAVSRAVRAPARFDRDVFFPGTPPFLVVGGPNFQSEVARVLEAGYRATPSARLSYSVTAYYHDWDKLRSGSSIPVELENRIEGDVTGLEAWATWQPLSRWQLRAGLSTLDKRLVLEPGSTDPVGVDNDTLANDADYQWLLRSFVQLSSRLELDVDVRRVGALPHPVVPAYTAVDARLGWRRNERLGLSLVISNLFDDSHVEFGRVESRHVLDRTALLNVSLRFDPSPKT
jgi:iron complex outermembrane receptor protein